LRDIVDEFNALYQECLDTQARDPKWLENKALNNVAMRANDLIAQFNSTAGDGVNCINDMSAFCGNARTTVLVVGVAASAVVIYAAAPAVLAAIGGKGAVGPLIVAKSEAASAVLTLVSKGFIYQRTIYSAGVAVGYMYRNPRTGQVIELLWGK
jgi:hypothetical protein